MVFKRLFPFLFVVAFLGAEPPDACQPEPGVVCGDQTCEAGQYCEVFYPGVYPSEPSYTCQDPPEACQGDQLTCDCLVKTETCPEMVSECVEDEAGPTCSVFAP